MAPPYNYGVPAVEEPGGRPRPSRHPQPVLYLLRIGHTMASMQVFRRVVRLLPLLPVSVLVALTTTTPVPGRWVDIFGAMPQLVESYNLPGPPYVSHPG